MNNIYNSEWEGKSPIPSLIQIVVVFFYEYLLNKGSQQKDTTMLSQIKEYIKNTKPDGTVARLKAVPQYWTEITNHSGLLPNKSAMIYLYLNQIVAPTCKCGKPVRFVSITEGYREFCSAKCPFCRERQLENRIATQTTNGGVGLARKSAMEKKNKTSLENNGYENYFGTEEHKQQLKENHPMHKEGVVDKIRQNCLAEHGVDWHSKRPDVKEKMKQTNYDIYGVENGAQKNYSLETLAILNDKEKLKELYENKHVEEIANQLDVCLKTVYTYLSKYNLREISFSTGEQQILQFLNSILNTEILSRTRKILPSKKELDIYIPEYKIAIEYCGLWWHSDLLEYNQKAHKDKMDECNRNNIRLITIFEDEWLFKQDLCKQRLLHIFGHNKSIIGARKINISIGSNTEIDFMDKYHIQGYSKSSVQVVGSYNGNIIGMMTFGRCRFSNEYQWEIIRFCTDGKHSYPGLANRLFSTFVKEYNPESILTFADLRWGDGKFYEHLGFTFIENTKPGYWYFGGNGKYKRYHRSMFMKHKLQILPNFNENLSEWELMKLNGWNRIWDCGNAKYRWKK